MLDTPSNVNPLDDLALVDELIPPAGTGRGRRALIVLIVLVVITTAVVSYGGWARPRVSVNGMTYGGDHTVHLSFVMHNEGPRTFEITGADPAAAGLSLQAVQAGPGARTFEQATGTGHSTPFPLRVPAGADVTIRFDFNVTDCHAIEQHRFVPFVVHTRLADPMLPWWHQAVDVSKAWPFVDNGNAGWPAAITQFACSTAP